MANTTFFKDRKIKNQQKTIERLQAENRQLKEKFTLLKDEYEDAKQVIDVAQIAKDEYEELIIQTKETKQRYEQLVREVEVLKAQYNKKMNNFIKELRRESNK